jgi:hypothetical protein
MEETDRVTAEVLVQKIRDIQQTKANTETETGTSTGTGASTAAGAAAGAPE